MQHTQLLSHAPATMASTASHRHIENAHLKAYNAVFSELGLRFRWNMETLAWLDTLECDGEKSRITTYLETCQPHLLKAYDAEFLSQLIYAKKREHFRAFGELTTA